MFGQNIQGRKQMMYLILAFGILADITFVWASKMCTVVVFFLLNFNELKKFEQKKSKSSTFMQTKYKLSAKNIYKFVCVYCFFYRMSVQFLGHVGVIYNSRYWKINPLKGETCKRIIIFNRFQLISVLSTKSMLFFILIIYKNKLNPQKPTSKTSSRSWDFLISPSIQNWNAASPCASLRLEYKSDTTRCNHSFGRPCASLWSVNTNNSGLWACKQMADLNLCS
jgi:hypothetical protein